MNDWSGTLIALVVLLASVAIAWWLTTVRIEKTSPQHATDNTQRKSNRSQG